MKKCLVVVTVFVLFGGFGLANSIWGQAAPTSAGRAVSAPPANVPAEYPGPNFFQADPSKDPFYYGYRGAARSEVARLVQELRDADDAKKADITKELEVAIDKQFDDDMKAREDELKKLEERLTKLRAQMDRRRKAKDEITKLQLKVLVNEADGLGFSGASVHDTGAGWVPYTNSDGAGGFRFVAPAKASTPTDPNRTKDTRK